MFHKLSFSHAVNPNLGTDGSASPNYFSAVAAAARPLMAVNDGIPSSVAVFSRRSVASSWASLFLTPL
jgi:hypothetical protein